MALSSALAQEGVSRVSQYISSKLDDKVPGGADIIARLEMALSRLDFVLERTGKLPITHVSLLRRRKMLKKAYMEGIGLLNKHRMQAQNGDEEAGQLAVRRYLQRVIASAANFSISSLFGLSKEHLSSSVAQTFEWYADCADKFVTDVESGCPLRRGIFPYPFVWQLFEGKTLRYQSMKGSQQVCFYIWPVILEGRGLEAYLHYNYFDTERLDNSFQLRLMQRLSESTDIVGTAIDCLRSSVSLLNLVAEDAMGELTLLHNLQDVTSSYAPPRVGIREWYTELTEDYRSDPLCCQANGHGPASVNSIISPGLSHMFPEQAIAFGFECYIIPALEHSLPISSNEAAGRNVMADRRRRSQPLELTLLFAPHYCLLEPTLEERCIFEVMGNQNERAHGNIQQMVGTVRSEAMDCLIRQPHVTNCAAYWISKHGYAGFDVKRPSTDMATVPKTSSRYKTRSAAKRKR